MNKFQEMPASKKSISNRKPVFGVGINDADYMVSTYINEKQVLCPYYRRWTNMLSRCYCHKYQEKYPTYIGCSVCDEWLTFSNFKSWMIKQDCEEKQLDKDLLFQNNKIYSPKACLFVSSEINILLTDCKSSRGSYPQGVDFHKPTEKYRASCRVNGKTKHLGLFDSVDLASSSYKQFKYSLIADIAEQQTEPLRTALLNYKIEG